MKYLLVVTAALTLTSCAMFEPTNGPSPAAQGAEAALTYLANNAPKSLGLVEIIGTAVGTLLAGGSVAGAAYMRNARRLEEVKKVANGKAQ